MSGKPLGVGIAMGSDGPRLYCTGPDRVTDQIWDAVREAIYAKITPEQFRREAAQAWSHYLGEDAKDAVKILNGGTNR